MKSSRGRECEISVSVIPLAESLGKTYLWLSPQISKRKLIVIAGGQLCQHQNIAAGIPQGRAENGWGAKEN